jgi:hypothetical protein
MSNFVCLLTGDSMLFIKISQKIFPTLFVTVYDLSVCDVCCYNYRKGSFCYIRTVDK